MAGSKCKPGQGQWALTLGVVLRCHKDIVLNGYGWTRQRFSAEGILGRERLQRRQIIHLRCHNFEPNRLVG